MLFNSREFVLFLPAVLAVYYLLPHRAQNRFLLAASIFFYASWDWRFLAPLLASTTIDYFCALKMESSILAGEAPARRKKFLVISLVTNLGLLGFFKYFDFFSGSMQSLLHGMGFHADLWTLRVILPVGISFYTFQALSYTIDVYRGEIHATPHFFDFLLCVIYFPHLVAGPIQRARSLLPQVVYPRKVTREQIFEGIHLILWGYFQKVVIADNLSRSTGWIFTDKAPDAFYVLFGTYAFAVQIFCDFSGYTDIARGVAKLMGFEFMLNFNLPYFAKNSQDFWRRWHISLSTWFRDYLYVPLGGNRSGAARVSFNLLITMTIAGLWHGAAWHFVLWGAYHGALLILHRAMNPLLSRIAPASAIGRAGWSAARILVMFHLTCYGWILFRAPSWPSIVALTRSLFHGFHVFQPEFAFWILVFSAPLVAIQMIQYFGGKLYFLDYSWIPAEARAMIYAVFFYLIVFRGGPPQAFIYFQF
ncbi:MAG: MBOAT family protein [Acidobacteriia bacterium]|nr:MBOAT family protein [Terriglobia bacterium]